MVEEPHIPTEILHEAAISAGQARRFIRSTSEVAIEKCRQTSISYVLVGPSGAVLGRILIKDVKSRAQKIIQRNRQRDQVLAYMAEAMRRPCLKAEEKARIEGKALASSRNETIAKSKQGGKATDKLKVNGGVATECGRCGAGCVHDYNVTE